MRTGQLLLVTVLGAALALPCAAEPDGGRKTRKFSEALRTKMAEGARAARTRSADATTLYIHGPLEKWTITPQQCGAVRFAVQGTGFEKTDVRVLANEDATFHVDIRTTASGTAEDSSGGKYMWIYTALADYDSPNVDFENFGPYTGRGHSTFQLIPASSGVTGYSMASFYNLTTPTTNDTFVQPVASNAPGGCDPRPAGAF